eukprot:2028340-Amphidinium_carterae.1
MEPGCGTRARGCSGHPPKRCLAGTSNTTKQQPRKARDVTSSGRMPDGISNDRGLLVTPPPAGLSY